MKPVLAIFALTELDELTATLCDIETKAELARMEDDPEDRRPFHERVRRYAATLGCEVQEWDRSALAA